MQSNPSAGRLAFVSRPIHRQLDRLDCQHASYRRARLLVERIFVADSNAAGARRVVIDQPRTRRMCFTVPALEFDATVKVDSDCRRCVSSGRHRERDYIIYREKVRDLQSYGTRDRSRRALSVLDSIPSRRNEEAMAKCMP